MPRYEFVCSCDENEIVYVINMSFSEYKSEISCPCGKGIAKRKFSSVTVQEGLTAKEKQFGTTTKRKNMADFMKDQRGIRKKSYDPSSREAKSNEIWTGKEGLDGVTSFRVTRKD